MTFLFTYVYFCFPLTSIYLYFVTVLSCSFHVLKSFFPFLTFHLHLTYMWCTFFTYFCATVLRALLFLFGLPLLVSHLTLIFPPFFFMKFTHVVDNDTTVHDVHTYTVAFLIKCSICPYHQTLTRTP